MLHKEVAHRECYTGMLIFIKISDLSKIQKIELLIRKMGFLDKGVIKIVILMGEGFRAKKRMKSAQKPIFRENSHFSLKIFKNGVLL